jgi:hypothetical protein
VSLRTITTDVAVFFRVLDAAKAVISVQDYLYATSTGRGYRARAHEHGANLFGDTATAALSFHDCLAAMPIFSPGSNGPWCQHADANELL